MLHVIVAFSVLGSSATAALAQCNSYKARDFDIRLVEDDRSLTVSWERYTEKLEKVIAKPWGVLQDAAVNMDDPGQPAHPFPACLRLVRIIRFCATKQSLEPRLVHPGLWRIYDIDIEPKPRRYVLCEPGHPVWLCLGDEEYRRWA